MVVVVSVVGRGVDGAAGRGAEEAQERGGPRGT